MIATIPLTERLHRAPRFVHRSIHWLGRAVGRSWTKPLAALRRELGLSVVPDPLFGGKYSPHLNLALFSRLIAAPQPDWPTQTVQAGFLFYDRRGHDEQAPPGLRAFLDAGDPPIVFTLGSSAVHTAGQFYDESIKAAKRLRRRAILLAGKNVLREELSAEIAAFDYAPFSEVMPRAACVVHQGGMGTTAQVLRAGVPQLVMPYGFDQPDNAARLERLGVARKIRLDDYDESSAARILGELLGDAACASKAKSVAAELRAEEGLNVACDAVERALG